MRLFSSGRVIFSVIGAALLLAIFAPRLLAPRKPQPPPAPPKDFGLYYRLKVGLTYKGQPIDVDIVGGCSVRASFSLANGGSTVETMAMSAFVFGVGMPEGHAVVIRSDGAQNGSHKVCRGATTANGDVPKDWLPLIVWYEHDDNFAHGIGYATQDAYESPRARFGFRGATIERATRADFEAFLKNGRKNLIPVDLADAMSHLDSPILPKPVPRDILDDPTKAWRFENWPYCRGAYRIRLTEEQRAKVRPFWPAGHPKYWVAPTDKILIDLRFNMLTRQQQDNDYEGIYRTPYTAAMRADQAKVYPISAGESLYGIKASLARDPNSFEHDVLVGDEQSWLGFEFCDVEPSLALYQALTNKPESNWHGHVHCRIGDFTVPTVGEGCDLGLWAAFENDEYEIVPTRLLTN